MNPKAQILKQRADEAKYLHANGEIGYDVARRACQEYIDFCNETAKRIAKEYGMKPKLMSVKAYMR